MEKPYPCVWVPDSAAAAAAAYGSAFPDARITSRTAFGDTPSGRTEVVTLDLSGSRLMLMSAASPFKLNPSISLMVSCSSSAEVDRLWDSLSAGGTIRMPLDSYPFSPRYGWIDDRFGASWQLFYNEGREGRSRIIPTLMFTGAVCGKAEEAMRFWVSAFDRAADGGVLRYGKDEAPDAEGGVKHEEFELEGRTFAAMDSAYPHGFGFNEAVSLVVECADQAEIDRLWLKLSAHPEAEACGWLKDRYGVSWQIVPRELGGMMSSGGERAARVVAAFLGMKKMDLAALKKAFEG